MKIINRYFRLFQGDEFRRVKVKIIIDLLQCLHMITHTGVFHANKLEKISCEMMCF